MNDDFHHACCGQSSTGTTNAFSRRLFLQQGMAFISTAATVPLFMQRSAHGVMLPLGSMVSSRAGVPEDRVLVVIQLGGGNDGLNTVVPYGSNSYYDLRPGLSIGEPGGTNRDGGTALAIPGADGIGLHPNLTGLRSLLDDGVASVIQGVGYPNPNRSHFTSMDIWHTANLSGNGHGWLGRYFDNSCGGTPNPEAAIAIGRSAPHALEGELQKPVTFESEELFRWAGGSVDEDLADPYDDINRSGMLSGAESGSQLDFLVRTSLDAQLSSDRIREAVAQRPLIAYPNGQLAQQLRLIGSMIRHGLSTRVYYASLGGFDTHANQLGQHGNLMRQVGGALKSFHDDLKAQGNSSRVVTMVFSEFGRRVAQNGSGGTDHGTAAPMFLVGDSVEPGLLGIHPSMERLDEGDLVYNLDFRQVYASVLDDWLGVDPNAVLGKPFKKVPVIKTT